MSRIPRPNSSLKDAALLLLFSLFLVRSPDAFAAVTRVEVVTGAPGNNMNLGTATTQGELVVVFSCNGHGGTSGGSVSDSGGQTYTAIWTSAFGGGWMCTLSYKQNSASGITWVNVSLGSGNSDDYSSSWVAHYTGVATSGALDQSAAITGSSQNSPWSSQPLSVNCTNELLIGADFSYSASTLASSGSWSTMVTQGEANGDLLGFSDWTISGAGSYQFTGTSDSSINFAGMASFRSSSSTCGFNHIQGALANSYTPGQAVVLAHPPTAGDLVVCGVTWDYNGPTPSGVVSVSDGNGNAYQETPSSPNDGTGYTALFYLLSAPANASSTIVATFGTDPYGSGADFWCDEFSPGGGVTSFDQDAIGGSGGSTSNVNAPSITPASSHELFYAATDYRTSGTLDSVNSPWTLAGGGLSTGNLSGGAEYDTDVSSTLAVGFSGDDGYWLSMAAAFQVSGGSFSQVQGAGSFSNVYGAGAIETLTLPSAPTPGDLVACGGFWWDGNPGDTAGTVTLSDGAGNIYQPTPSSPFNDSGGSSNFLFYLLKAPANASPSITVTTESPPSALSVWCDEFSPPTGASIAFDKDATAECVSGPCESSSIVDTPSLTPAGPGELLYSFGNVADSITAANAPWVLAAGGIDSGNACAYDTSASSATAVSFSVDTPGVWDAMAMAFAATMSSSSVRHRAIFY